MHYLVISAFIMLSSQIAFAQSQDSALSPFEASQEVIEAGNFKLYPTENMYTFLKLDTRDGTIKQLQWSQEDATRFESNLNLWPLVEENERKPNRFILYPTQNMYEFILLDQINGNTWQVQWSFEYSKRLIVPISS